MQKIPTVAIITRTRNRTHLLQRAVKSVLQQSMANWHHWIVNDGGDPAPVKAILDGNADAYAGRFSLLNTEHAGMQNASNTAIMESDSEYIAILDDDDSWHRDFLRETTSFLTEHGGDSKYQGVICKTERILEEEQTGGGFREVERKPYVPLNTISLCRLGYENPFPPVAFVYRRSVLTHLEGYDPAWDLVADLDFNFRFLQKFEIGVIDKVLAYYHWREGAGSRDSLNTVTLQKTRHGRLLTELKNHYLRNADSTRSSTMALAFLVSSYAVENQWMTSEIRERSLSSQARIDALAEETRLILRFNEKSVWPKLEELSELLHLTNVANSQLEELRKFNNDTSWPKLEANENKNQEILDRLESCIRQIDGLKSLMEPVYKLEAIHSMLSQLQSRQNEVLEKQEQLTITVQGIKRELEQVRDENHREWRLGPFRLKRAQPSTSEDPENLIK